MEDSIQVDVNDPPPNAHGRLRWGLGEKRKASAK